MYNIDTNQTPVRGRRVSVPSLDLKPWVYIMTNTSPFNLCGGDHTFPSQKSQEEN